MLSPRSKDPQEPPPAPLASVSRTSLKAPETNKIEPHVLFLFSSLVLFFFRFFFLFYFFLYFFLHFFLYFFLYLCFYFFYFFFIFLVFSFIFLYFFFGIIDFIDKRFDEAVAQRRQAVKARQALRGGDNRTAADSRSKTVLRLIVTIGESDLRQTLQSAADSFSVSDSTRLATRILRKPGR